jgi:hypothetical protein
MIVSFTNGVKIYSHLFFLCIVSFAHGVKIYSILFFFMIGGAKCAGLDIVAPVTRVTR